MSTNVTYQEKFQHRHIATNSADTQAMLKTIGVKSIEELIDQTVPANIRLKQALRLVKQII